MKFPNLKGLTIALIYCFTFYAICGCSSARQTTSYLDKYDSMPLESKHVVGVSENVAYKSAILSLQKRGYILTLSDPQTGTANLELTTSTKLPEEEKQIQANDSGPSVGTVILYVLAIVLVVGIVAILLSSSDDDSKENEKKDKTEYRKGKTDTGHPSDQASHRIDPPPPPRDDRDHRGNEHHHRHPSFIGPYFASLLIPQPVQIAPASGPAYRYIVAINTTALTDSTTEIGLTTTRVDLLDGNQTNQANFTNKYLNYGIFDGIDEQIGGK